MAELTSLVRFNSPAVDFVDNHIDDAQYMVRTFMEDGERHVYEERDPR